MERVSVLLVEDDPVIRTLVGVVLQRAGFTVLDASDAEQALHASRSNGKIDVVLTDVHLGDGRLDGFELAALIVRERPDVPVIIMSGNLDNQSLAAEKGFSFL